MKAQLSVCLSLLLSLYAWSATAEPIGPGTGPSTGLTSCQRCAACPKNGSTNKTVDPIGDTTANSQKASQCKADCADCVIRGMAPATVPANPANSTNQTIEKQ
jgi:hypothetical protein